MILLLFFVMSLPVSIAPGCFAWSPARGQVACVVGRRATNDCGGDRVTCASWHIELVGSDEPWIALGEGVDREILGDERNLWGVRTTTFTLGDEARARLARLVRDAALTPLPGARTQLAKGRRLRHGRLTLRWTDALEARCPGHEAVPLGLPLSDGTRIVSDRSEVQQAKVLRLPGGRLLVESYDGYAMEGQSASAVAAAVVDADCNVSTSSVEE